MPYEKFKQNLTAELNEKVLFPYNKNINEMNEADGKSKTNGTISHGTIKFKDKAGQLPIVDLGILANAIRGSRLDRVAKEIIERHYKSFKI